MIDNLPDSQQSLCSAGFPVGRLTAACEFKAAVLDIVIAIGDAALFQLALSFSTVLQFTLKLYRFVLRAISRMLNFDIRLFRTQTISRIQPLYKTIRLRDWALMSVYYHLVRIVFCSGKPLQKCLSDCHNI